MNTAEMLEECCARWEWPEGKIAAMQAKMRRHRDFNADCQGDAIPLDRIRHYQLLLEQGRVVWSSVVQASGELYAPGATDGPALVVYGTANYYMHRPEALAHVAARIFALKEADVPEDNEQAPLIASLNGSAQIAAPIAVPLAVSAGHLGAFLAPVLVHRRRLPAGRLTLPGLPLVVCPEKIDTIMVLPLRYWSPNLVRLWREEDIALGGKASSGVRVTGLFSPEEPASATEEIGPAS